MIIKDSAGGGPDTSNGLLAGARILTDYLSGRTDRVVEEFTVENIGEFEGLLAKAVADPAIAAQFGQTEQALFALIEYSEVEHWAIQAAP